MTRHPAPVAVDATLHAALLERYAGIFGVDGGGWRAWTWPEVPAEPGARDVILIDGEAEARLVEQVSRGGSVLVETDREGGQWIDTVRSPSGTWALGVPATDDTPHGPRFIAQVLACLSLHFPAQDAVCLARAWHPESLDWPEDFSRFPRVRHPALVAPETPAAPFVPCPPALGLYAVVPNADWIGRLVPLAVPTVQLRVKSDDDAVVRQQIALAAQAARGNTSRLFINDHWRAALDYHAEHGPDSGIYGIHLGQEDLDDADLDALRASGLRLGVSTHGYAEMLRVAALGPSYLALGAIFPTTTKSLATAPQGLGRFQAYVRLMRSQVPSLVGIGGIDAGNLPQVLAAGAGSAAVVRAITEATDLPGAVIALKGMFLPH